MVSSSTHCERCSPATQCRSRAADARERIGLGDSASLGEQLVPKPEVTRNGAGKLRFHCDSS